MAAIGCSTVMSMFVLVAVPMLPRLAHTLAACCEEGARCIIFPDPILIIGPRSFVRPVLLDIVRMLTATGVAITAPVIAAGPMSRAWGMNLIVMAPMAAIDMTPWAVVIAIGVVRRRARACTDDRAPVIEGQAIARRPHRRTSHIYARRIITQD